MGMGWDGPRPTGDADAGCLPCMQHSSPDVPLVGQHVSKSAPVLTGAPCAGVACCMQVLSHALVATLSIARAESPAIVQAYMRDGSGPLPPLLSPAVHNILVLAARLLASLPRGLWTPELVPAAITDTLAAVARDDVLCLLLPGLRPAAQPLLACLRPDVQLLLDVAADGEAALSAADVLARQVPLLRDGAVTARQWLAQLALALPALHLPGQQALLQAAIDGLSLACRAAAAAEAEAGGEAGGWEAQAEGVFLQLLAHPQHGVMMSCYGLLESMLAEARGQQQHHLLRLLARKVSGEEGRVNTTPWLGRTCGGGTTMQTHAHTHMLATCARRDYAPTLRAQCHLHPPLAVTSLLHCNVPLLQPVLGHLCVAGLGDERTRRQVARILMLMLGDAHCQAGEGGRAGGRGPGQVQAGCT